MERNKTINFEVNDKMRIAMDDMCKRAGYRRGPFQRLKDSMNIILRRPVTRQDYQQLLIDSADLFTKALDTYESGGKIVSRNLDGVEELPVHMIPLSYAAGHGTLHRTLEEQ